jgi:hypothetical protein
LFSLFSTSSIARKVALCQWIGAGNENRTMGTLVKDKDAWGRSKFWYYAYTSADGRRLKKFTKETDRRKAKIIPHCSE